MEAARSTGADAPASCWCQSVDFTAALKAPLPNGARDVACICARCAAHATAGAATTQAPT
ncbi:cysteine-rich CWC family protein [Variovorax sp. PvP013]|uniref:cysteine-rich CWC family protein n=1 Tax=Variovorax sp. PvP013 TaxID=3156435 RepID=UPI003D1E782C